MADLQKTIEIIFGGKDNVSPTIKNITKELGTIDSAVQGIADPFADFTVGLLKAEASVAVLAAAMVGFAVNEAGQLKSSVTEIGTLFNAQPAQVEAMRVAILEYGRDSVFSFEDITASTYDMVSATGDVEGAVDALAIAEQAAVVGATGLNTAVNALTTVTNAYGLELDSSNDVLGAFIIAVQNGKTTLPELEASIGRVAATAAGSKLPFDDLLAAVAALTAGGINTAESMTGLNALLKELAKPTDALQAALGGVSLETDGLQAVMQQLELATGGNFTSMTQLFGSIEATKTAMVLGNDAAGVFEKTLGQMDGKSVVLAQNFELMADNVDLTMQNMVNNIKGTLINIGSPLLDEFGTSVGAISDIFKTLGIEIESGALKPLEDALESFAQSASASLEGVAKALPDALGHVDFSSLIASFENLGGVFEDVFGQIFGADLDLTKPEDLAKALQTAVNIAKSFVNITGEIIKGFSPIFEALGEAGKRMGGTSTETEEAIGKFLSSMTLLGEFGTALGGLAIVIEETGSDIGTVFDFLIGGATAMVNGLQVAFDAVVGIIAYGAASIFEALDFATPDWQQDLLGVDYGALADKFNTLSASVGENFRKNMSEASDGVHQMTQGLAGVPIPADKAAEGVKKTSEEVKILADKSKNLKESAPSDELDKLSTSANKAAEPVEKTADAMVKLDAASKAYASEQDKLNALIAEADAKGLSYVAGIIKGEAQIRLLGDAHGKAATQVDKTTKATSKLSKEQELAIKNTHDMETTLLELASNEKISAMKFTADIEVAKIEGQAKQVEAAFQSIGTTVDAAAQAAADMTGVLGKLFSEDAHWTKTDVIEDFIQQQIDIEKRGVEMQERLIEQQIEYMQAQVDALYNETVVKIESSGLEKDIEAFMFEILKRIQLKVAGDKSAFLLGL